MKAKDADTLSTLRMLKAALMEAQTKKAKDSPLSRDEELEILQRYVKKRRETVEEMRKLGRDDMVASEHREIAITERYLPAMLSESELAAIVAETVARVGAASPKDTGKVMGAVMAQVKGRADGSVVGALVKKVLGG
jgi:hypothetical protein